MADDAQQTNIAVLEVSVLMLMEVRDKRIVVNIVVVVTTPPPPESTNFIIIRESVPYNVRVLNNSALRYNALRADATVDV